MDSYTIEILFLVLVVIIVALPNMRVLRRGKVSSAEWGDLDVYAQALGLEHTTLGSKRALVGRVRGVFVSITLGPLGRAVFECRHPQPVTSMKIFAEELGAAIGKSIGQTQDLEIGDAAFDERMVIQGDDLDTIARLLTPEVRKMLLHASVVYPGVVLDTQGVRWKSPETGHTLREVESAVESFVDLVLAIQRTMHEHSSDVLEGQAHAEDTSSQTKTAEAESAAYTHASDTARRGR